MGKDQKKQKKRAAELREQIAEILQDKEVEAAPAHRRNAPRVQKISPREFIHKRMKELKKTDKQDDG